MDQIIHLAPDDDITAIKSRLEWADARRVRLVLPRRKKTLRNVVDHKVLAPTTDPANIETALVQQAIATRDAAKHAGLKTLYPL